MMIEQLARLIDAQLADDVGWILRYVPFAAHLTNDEQVLHNAYYIRHRIETVKRIRMTAKTDALALASLIDVDYEAAREWNHYTSQEMNHDKLFIRDLEHHGYTEASILSVETFPATIQMVEYLNRSIQAVGALPAIAYSLFVEWNSERASAHVVARAQKSFSQLHVAGAKAHQKIDEDARHYADILRLADRLVKQRSSADALSIHLKDIALFFATYFMQLYQSAILDEKHSKAALKTAFTSDVSTIAT